jgi:hypothetical protein
MNTGLDAFGIIENESWSARHENRIPRPSVPPKTGHEAQNMKTGPNALGTVENVFGSA